MSQKNNSQSKKIILNIMMVICLCIAVGSGIYLFKYYHDSQKAEDSFDSLKELVVEDEIPKDNQENPTNEPELVDVDGEKVQKKYVKLYQENKDFVGWITIKDTNIDYPVMFSPSDGENGEYYIHRDYNKEYSAAGTPFIDGNCSLSPRTDNVIIYGHNMNSGKMFHDLLKFEDETFYSSHQRFTFNTISEDATYEIVAIIRGQVLPEESKEFKYYEFVNSGTKEDFDSYISNIKNMSVINTNVKVEYGDELLTLSTCAYHTTDGRFAVIAKKVK